MRILANLSSAHMLPSVCAVQNRPKMVQNLKNRLPGVWLQSGGPVTTESTEAFPVTEVGAKAPPGLRQASATLYTSGEWA